ncbi:MAG: cytochrome c [Chloroflexi bacterium]|nr:cytochrome c [Chloroflexota bacterium]
MKTLILAPLILALAACGGDAVPPSVKYPLVPTSASIALGASLYAENCTVCHADPVTGGERQFDAPRHDADGHTWHHPDRPLVQWVLESPPGGSIMPPFAGRLSEEEAAAIIGYIKSTWPDDLQARHTELSQAWEDQVGAQ